MIDVANMTPGVSPRSGRKYFRGRDRRGTTWWMIEVKNSGGQRWVLSFDPPHDLMGDLPPTISGFESRKAIEG